jgi:hypothetical protein
MSAANLRRCLCCGRSTYQLSRGLCRHECYWKLRKRVAGGIHTWPELVALGRCLPTGRELGREGPA